MFGPLDKGLALIGIGGYYLHKNYVWADKYEVEGPYNRPYNPYGDGLATPGYGMTFESKYHLRKPKDAISPPGIEKG
jgi:hypothetical protein